ncbi:MAG TPA: response regulator, partial [Cyclobacteriaceae bacterium]|nr:response regulator [Cyclobacteriaceae bacterium]
MKCIIVDDEPLARKGLQEYCTDLAYLQNIESFESAMTAGTYLTNHPVDLMLLDIRMPKLSGIDFLRNLKTPPLVIFTTAFPDYALESYELNVIDYLVKPISFERFSKATQKAFDYFLLKQKQTEADYFFIKSNQQLEKVPFN